MKICVFSDLHGNYEALDKMLEAQKDADRFYFLGDVFGYFLEQKKIIDRMLSTNNLIAVRGNHDAYYLRSLADDQFKESMVEKYGSSYKHMDEDGRIADFIEEMSECLKENIDGINLSFYHGGPVDYLEQRIYPDTNLTSEKHYDEDFVFVGHTHYRMNKEFQNEGEKGKIINPGSLGQPRDGHGFSYCVLDTVTRRIEFKSVELDIDSLLKSVYDAEGESNNYKYLYKKYKG